MNVIFWDTETNGLTARNSVLSISAIKCYFGMEGQSGGSGILERYERFYFRKPGEKLGEEAISVNGLSEEVINTLRKNAAYPQNFCDDINSFRLFCSDTRHFVGHNINYDKKYIDFELANMFCTMKHNTIPAGLKRPCGKPKYPSLGETAVFYGIEFDENQLHRSMYDAFITYQVFCKMLDNEKTRREAISFLEAK